MCCRLCWVSEILINPLLPLALNRGVSSRKFLSRVLMIDVTKSVGTMLPVLVASIATICCTGWRPSNTDRRPVNPSGTTSVSVAISSGSRSAKNSGHRTQQETFPPVLGLDGRSYHLNAVSVSRRGPPRSFTILRKTPWLQDEPLAARCHTVVTF